MFRIQMLLFVALSLFSSCGSNTTSPIGSGNLSSSERSSVVNASSRVLSSSSGDLLSSTVMQSSSSSLSGPILDTAWGSVNYDGKTYKTISINGQTWFAENLNMGTMIVGQGSFNHQDDDNMVEKFCYGDVEGMCDDFGGLYEWAEAMSLPSACNQTVCATSITIPHQGICPEHWHIPSQAELDTLISDLGGASVAGFYAKGKSGYTSWDADSNSLGYSGFNMLPSGMRSATGSYVNSGLDAHLWSSDEGLPQDSYGYMVWSTSKTLVKDLNDKNAGYSVRCILDQ